MRLIWMTVSWLRVKTADGCLLFDSRWVINYSSAPASAAFACHVCLTGGLLWRDAGPIRAVHVSASNVYLGKKKTAWYQRENLKPKLRRMSLKSEMWAEHCWKRTSEAEWCIWVRILPTASSPRPRAAVRTSSWVPGLRGANEGKI